MNGLACACFGVLAPGVNLPPSLSSFPLQGQHKLSLRSNFTTGLKAYLDFTNTQTDHLFYILCPLPLSTESPGRTTLGRLSMYLLLIRWRAKKVAKHADQQISQIRLLLDVRGAEMEPGDRSIIQERLV